LPGDENEIWEQSIGKAMDLDPEHLSVYTLTVEEESKLYAMVKSGLVKAVDDETQIRNLDMAESLLVQHGYIRYEISNYAKPGYECLHNLACWRGEDYIGFGPGASSRSRLNRWTNEQDLGRYIESAEHEMIPPRETHNVSELTNSIERIMFGFRLSEGVDLDVFSDTGAEIVGKWENVLEEMRDDGLVKQAESRWVLTGKGRNYADSVAQRMIVS
jgi:oxygen-independent coproporphyrinogen-3 oxidase